MLFVFFWVLAFQQILKELQVSLSFRCLIFKVLRWTLFSFADKHHACEPFYSITFASLCQVLFWKFLRIFLSSQPLRVCDSLFILSHRVRFVKHFFVFFKTFFCPPPLRSSFLRQLFSLYRAAFCVSQDPSLCDSVGILTQRNWFVKRKIHYFLPNFQDWRFAHIILSINA